MSASKYLKASKKTISLLDQKGLTISQLKQIQSHLAVTATLKDPYAAAKIISLYAHSNAKNSLFCAERLFICLQNKSTFIWNTMMQAFVEKNQPITAFSLYKHMLESNYLPNNFTFSFVIRACTDVFNLQMGLCFHGQIVKFGWESYDFVQNGLIHLYANCGFMDLARKMFDMSTKRDVFTWTCLISGYLKSGQVLIARELFDRMPEKNPVSWGAMIAGHVQIGFFKEALEIFYDMQVSGFRLNHASIVGALTACAFLGALDQGRWIHAYVKRHRIVLDRMLGTALIDMYAKCGCIEMAGSVFDEMDDRDVYALTCLISGLANHDKSEAAIDLFDRMQDEGVVPNEVTFVCVLNACSRMGMVAEGLRIFERMSNRYGIDPQIQHYSCLVDLLGRAGRIEEAKKVVREMPLQPDSYTLGALLDACRVHGDVQLGEEMADSLAQRCLDHGGVHVLLSNMYASADKWEDVSKIRKKMEDKNIRKLPGCSSIEVNGTVCEFVTGDRSYALEEDIKFLLFGIDKNLKSLSLDDDDDHESVTMEQVFS
ncbi:hypothetical protein DKX38_027461 [Salix brachista]|uniref:Pentacotripeptide-repeat region of PRORP domain-containing protein n=1 Tax=Salix brachista TaxID=2182728 RepID=A0A5N5JH61_9ROSI|nr:hypothetical protein DKX38_027461 [Salix brachista]